MEETFLSGYCRQIDGSRMVAVEYGGGEKDADCCYPDCPYAKDCTIAKQIDEL